MARPKRQSALFSISDSLETLTSFEKMPHSPRPAMPAASNRQLIRSARKTAGSQRAGKQFSASMGGIHRRRNKRGF